MILPGSAMLRDALRPIVRRELREEASFDEAFGRVELALAIGFAERTEMPSGQYWVPPAYVAHDPRLATKIVEAWRNDYAERAERSDPSVMGGLKRAPDFDKLVDFLGRMRFGQ